MGNLVVLDNDPEVLSLAVLPPPKALDRNPAAVSLTSLPSPESRRTLRATLEGLAGFLSGGTAGAARIPPGVPSATRTRRPCAQPSCNGYRPATINKYLAVLRRVLRSAVRLNFMDLATYQAATDFKGVKGETLPRGRRVARPGSGLPRGLRARRPAGRGGAGLALRVRVTAGRGRGPPLLVSWLAEVDHVSTRANTRGRLGAPL